MHLGYPTSLIITDYSLPCCDPTATI